MLANLIQVEQRIFESTTNSSHSTKRCSLQLLALEEWLGVLEKPNIVARDSLNEMFRRRQLSKSYAKMVGIVEGVQEILMKRMDIL